MPKMKTNRGAAKRFKKTASGGFKRGHAYHSHILTKKIAEGKTRLARHWHDQFRRQESRQALAAAFIKEGQENG